MKRKLCIPLFIGWFLLLTAIRAFPQVGINTDGTPPDPSAGLDVKFSNKGLLLPRVTTAQMYAIANPVSGLYVFCTDCGPSGTGAIALFMNGGWYAVNLGCQIPSSGPVAGTSVPSNNQVIWNWNTVPAATGYKWNTVSNYATSTDLGATTTKTEPGLTCNTPYTRYVWAYNGCGYSVAAAISQSTTSDPPVSVSVAPSGNSVCAGTPVSFTATPVSGGSSPVYQWKVNGINAGTNNPVYTYSPVNNDVITCVLTSNDACAVGSPATSVAVTMAVVPLLPVSLTIAASANPFCLGNPVNFTTAPVNGGSTPLYQWKKGGTNISGATGSTYSYYPVNGDLITCQLTSNATCASGNPALSNAVTLVMNSPLAIPAAGANTPDLNQITWNWNPAAGAAGYKWNTTNSYATATDVGTLTSKTETGLTCSTAYTRYAWAYNICGNSQPITLSQSTMVCWSCGLVFTDPRDGKNYNTVTIGTQCWMAQNLNAGLRVNANVMQTNNSIIEKYCTGDLEATCYTYGGLYQWDELMQYSTANGSQGICPAGWHIPTDGEYTALITLLGGSGDAGGPMKEAGTVHWAAPNTGATNSSGFTALPGGDRNTGFTYTNLTTIGFYWTSTMIDASNAWIRMLYNNFSGAYPANGARTSGLSVRCIHN